MNEKSSDWAASRTHSNWILADRKDCLDAVVDGLIGFICDTGTAVNFNLEVGKRLDDFAVDVGRIEFGGGAVDDAVFVSPVNEDIMDLLGSSLWTYTLYFRTKKRKNKNSN